MKRHLSGILVVFSFLTVQAQQDPLFSQYMFNQAYYVPALMAVDGQSSVSFFSRSQWLGYETSFDQQGGAPNTQFLSFATPLNVLNVPLGVGANIIYDKTGPLTNMYLQPTAAYSLELPRGTFHMGMRPTIVNQYLDGTALDFVNPVDLEEYGQRDSQFAFDLDAGVAFSTDDYLIGFGLSHLLRPTYVYGTDGSGEPTPMLYSLYGEYTYPINAQLTLTPSLLVQTDINAYTFNLGAVATLDEKMWGGLTYRNREAITLLLGYSFFENNSLRFGYSFDYIIDDQTSKAVSSHELYIKYYLPSLNTGSKKVIRTPRFRF